MLALAKKANKLEKTKNEKAGDRIWTEIEDLAALVRSGEKTWEELNLDDVDVRTKWAGLFHRKKRAPGTFMMRLKVLLLLPIYFHSGLCLWSLFTVVDGTKTSDEL